MPVAAEETVAERSPRADARRNRERIVAAGREVFARLGDDARMDDIARAAGVGVGTVYRHFPTKEALMAHMLAAKWLLMSEHMKAALASDGDPWDAFAGALRRNAGVMAEDAAVRYAVMRAGSPEIWEGSAEAHAELMDATAGMISRCAAAGVIRADLTVDDIPMAMCGVCATIDTRGPAGEADWRRHLELVLQGMRA